MLTKGITVQFNAPAAAEVLNRIGAGQGIPTPAGGHWDQEHALLAAAALLFAVRASAPTSEKPMHKEHAEARLVQIQGEVFAAVAWLMDRCQDLQTGKYADHFADVARASIIVEGDGTPHVIASEGFKAKHGERG
jgi:hypothetical protein